MTYVIAAAGTGGHVYPALAVAEALVRQGVARSEVVFIGGDRFEADAVPRAGFNFIGFPLTKLRRSLSPENLRIPVVVRRTAAAMADEIRRAEGRVVLGMSGYVTVPASMAARRAGVPFFLQEQNASPGLAARLAARTAVTSFLGLPGKAETLPRSEVVGNPLRSELTAFDRRRIRPTARRLYSVEDRGAVLGVLGGSLGARVLNQAVSSLVESSGAGAIVHLTGPAAYDEFEQMAQRSRGVPWVTRPFESEMQRFYAAVDLVVCRAGAMTVSELAATATPAILVPLARVGQQWNARALSEAGGAEIVEEGDIGSLSARVAALLGNEPRLVAMSHAAAGQARPAAADTIATRLIEATHG